MRVTVAGIALISLFVAPNFTSLAVASATEGAVSAEWTTDLDAIASANGWTRSEAIAYSHSEQAVGQLAERVAIERPEAFVGSALSIEPTTAPTLFIKGPADADILDLVAHAGADILLVDNQPFSAFELDTRALRVNAAVRALGYPDVTTRPDITARGQLLATVTSAATDRGTADDIASNLPSDLRSDVRIILEASPVVKNKRYGAVSISRTPSTPSNAQVDSP